MPPKNIITKIRKRCGDIVDFDRNKIIKAVLKAMEAAGELDEKRAKKYSDYVVKKLSKKFHAHSIPAVEEIQDMVSDGILAPGSARALVTVEDKNLQLKLARKIASGGLSSRKAEELVRRALTQKPQKSTQIKLSPLVEATRLDIQRILGTDVKMKGSDSRGKIEISYYSQDDLERILELLKGEPLE